FKPLTHSFGSTPEKLYVQALGILISIYDHEGRDRELLPLKERHCTMVEKEGSDEDFAQCLSGLAYIYSKQGRDVEALALRTQALKILETITSQKPSSRFALQQKADLYAELGRYNEAAALYEQTPYQEGFARAVTLETLARIYVRQLRFDDARSKFVQ